MHRKPKNPTIVGFLAKIQYRTPEGRTRRLNIAKWSDALTAEQARKQARKLAREVHAGADPQGEKKARRTAKTLNELLDDYLASETFRGKAESTRAIALTGAWRGEAAGLRWAWVNMKAAAVLPMKKPGKRQQIVKR